MVNHAGVVSLEIHPLDENKPVVGVNALQLWMYDDEESSWPSIKFKDMGCKERRARARGVFSLARWFDAKKQAMKHAFEISEHQRPRCVKEGLVLKKKKKIPKFHTECGLCNTRKPNKKKFISRNQPTNPQVLVVRAGLCLRPLAPARRGRRRDGRLAGQLREHRLAHARGQPPRAAAHRQGIRYRLPVLCLSVWLSVCWCVCVCCPRCAFPRVCVIH